MPRRRRLRRLTAILTLLTVGLAAGCANKAASGQGGLSAVNQTAAVPAGSSAAPGTSPTTPPTTPATASATATPTVDPASTHATSSVHMSATVAALSAGYTGLCAPPATATSFEANIKVTGVTAGHPVTVHWRWRTSNGGDSDPSTQSHTFTASGTYTTTHNESAYPPSPYPKTLNDWVAIVISGVGPAVTSGHIAYTIKCLPWVAVLSGVSTDYSGSCPPSSSALTFSLRISVSYPITMVFHFHTANGGDSDPSTHTVIVVPGAPLVVNHSETSYVPHSTTADYVEAAVAGAGTSGSSNPIAYTETCT